MNIFWIGIMSFVSTLGYAGVDDGWLEAVLNYDAYEWKSATLPGSDRRDQYAADILFQESQATGLRGHILRNIASVSGPVDAQHIAKDVRLIVDTVEAINPNSDIILPSVLLRADMGGEWIKEISFQHEDLKTSYYPFLLCALSLEVMRREYEYVNMHRPTDQQNGFVSGENATESSFNLPTMAFYREDRIKKDLANSLVVLVSRENIDRIKLKEIAQELNVSESVHEWAKDLWD